MQRRYLRYSLAQANRLFFLASASLALLRLSVEDVLFFLGVLAVLTLRYLRREVFHLQLAGWLPCFADRVFCSESANLLN